MFSVFVVTAKDQTHETNFIFAHLPMTVKLQHKQKRLNYGSNKILKNFFLRIARMKCHWTMKLAQIYYEN